MNISKLNFGLVIFIAKNYIWTTLKTIFFNIVSFFAPSDYRFSNSCISAKYCPIITKHTSTESLFIQLPCDVYISILKNRLFWPVLWCRVTFVFSANCQFFSSYFLFLNGEKNTRPKAAEQVGGHCCTTTVSPGAVLWLVNTIPLTVWWCQPYNVIL